MPYQSMSLEDFSRYIGMDVREVCRLADRGKLPGQKVGGQWRFNRAVVIEWLQQEIHTLDRSRLIALEVAMRDSQAEVGQRVTDMIGLEGIAIALNAKTKASILRELVGLAERTGLLYDAEGLLKALEQREAICSTALLKGIAIPHPRQPMPYVSAEPLVCVARLPSAVGFGSAYGDRTDIFFLICCHDDRQHLHTLARIMRILQGETIDRLRAAETAEELLQVLIDRELEIEARPNQ
jgi:PTS system nitrogen regulatory IIA component